MFQLKFVREFSNRNSSLFWWKHKLFAVTSSAKDFESQLHFRKKQKIVHGELLTSFFTSHVNVGHALRIEVKWVYDDKALRPGTYCYFPFCNRSLYVQSVQLSPINYYPQRWAELGRQLESFLKEHCQPMRFTLAWAKGPQPPPSPGRGSVSRSSCRSPRAQTRMVERPNDPRVSLPCSLRMRYASLACDPSGSFAEVKDRDTVSFMTEGSCQVIGEWGQLLLAHRRSKPSFLRRFWSERSEENFQKKVAKKRFFFFFFTFS